MGKRASLTDRLTEWLERARRTLPRQDADDLEDLIVEVAMIELGEEAAVAWSRDTLGHAAAEARKELHAIIKTIMAAPVAND